MRVAILGSGPSACFAAWAARDCGVEHVDILSKDGPGLGPGAGHFYLHYLPKSAFDALPLSVLQAAAIQMHRTYSGTRKEFVSKQWGDDAWALGFQAESSGFGRDDDPVYWRAPVILQQMWGRLLCDSRINLVPGRPLNDEAIQALLRHGSYDRVFQTFPSARALAEQPPLQFYLIRQEPWLRETHSLLQSHFFMAYNGEKACPWTRMSLGDGVISTEFTLRESARILEQDPDVVRSPLWYRAPIIHPSTHALPEQDGVTFLGRFARWDHSLVHDAYLQTWSALKGQPLSVEEGMIQAQRSYDANTAVDVQSSAAGWEGFCDEARLIMAQRKGLYGPAYRYEGVVGVVGQIMTCVTRLRHQVYALPEQQRSGEAVGNLLRDTHNFCLLALECLATDNWQGLPWPEQTQSEEEQGGSDHDVL